MHQAMATDSLARSFPRRLDNHRERESKVQGPRSKVLPVTLDFGPWTLDNDPARDGDPRGLHEPFGTVFVESGSECEWVRAGIGNSEHFKDGGNPRLSGSA